MWPTDCQTSLSFSQSDHVPLGQNKKYTNSISQRLTGKHNSCNLSFQASQQTDRTVGCENKSREHSHKSHALASIIAHTLRIFKIEVTSIESNVVASQFQHIRKKNDKIDEQANIVAQ